MIISTEKLILYSVIALVLEERGDTVVRAAVIELKRRLKNNTNLTLMNWNFTLYIGTITSRPAISCFTYDIEARYEHAKSF